jgi:hypothetical protein
MRIPKQFTHLRQHIDAFLARATPNRKNVFVMMRYKQANQYQDIENTIRTSLQHRGLNCHLAKDHTFLPTDMWGNLCVYMLACDFGISVFEQIDDRDFNPNVSMETGFMLAADRPLLLLKEQRMVALPTDVCGHLYKPFDSYSIATSVTSAVSQWIDDLRARGIL